MRVREFLKEACVWVKTHRQVKKNRRGFTLIELMLVVILLGLLVAITLPRFTGRTRKAAIAAARTDINGTISVALDLFEMDNQIYPTTTQGLAALIEIPRTGTGFGEWNGPYVKKAIANDPWGNPYHYQSPGQHNKRGYDLWSNGPDGIHGNEDDITNW